MDQNTLASKAITLKKLEKSKLNIENLSYLYGWKKLLQEMKKRKKYK